MKIEERVARGKGKHKVAVIELHGKIQQGKRKGVDLAADITQQFARAASDKTVCGVVLDISSPGGSVTTSDVIYETVRTFASIKPVVAYIPDLGASGGYYVACGADKIYAHETAIVGSIGVILQNLNVENFLDKLGLRPVTFTSGPFKDAGSPFREMREDEKRYIQEMIQQTYERFVGIVKSRRTIPEEVFEEVTSGKVFLAKDALARGLIDGTCYFADVVERVRQSAVARFNKKIPSVRTVRYRIKYPQPFLRRFLAPEGAHNVWEELAEELFSSSQVTLSYLWVGHR